MKPLGRWLEPPETAGARAFREHREDLNRRLRVGYLSGAEERGLERLGRPLTADELIEAILPPPVVAQYELTARLVGRTHEAIEFSVPREVQSPGDAACPALLR